MKIKAILKNLEDAPQAMREFYEEKDGVYILAIEGVQEHPDVTGLKKALDDEKEFRRKRTKELEEANKKLERVPDDFDIDEYNRLKDSDGGKVDEKLKEQRERLTAQHKKELEKKDQEIRERDELINSQVKMSTLRKALTEAKIAPHFQGAVEAMFSQRLTIEGKGQDAQVLLDEKPIAEYLKDWAASDDGKHFVAAPGNTGGGTGGKPGGSGKGQVNPWKKETRNLTEQARIRKEDPDLARTLMEEAGLKANL